MKRYLLFISIVIFLFSLAYKAGAQNSQTVSNGSFTGAINFPAGGCVYDWVNDSPGIGLSASGRGNIPSFTAINNGGSAVTASIAATPVPTGYAYIANYGSDNVSVINTATGALVTTIGVGTGPGGVSASPDGSRVFVVNDNSNNVSVINTAANTVIATIAVGNFPSAVTVSRDGSQAFVSNVIDGTVSVIATSSNTVTATINGFNEPYFLAASPSTNLLYVANSPLGTISVVNTLTNVIEKTITVGNDPIQIVASPDGSWLYTTNQKSNTISVIDAATNTVAATIQTDDSPYGESLSPDGSFLYVGCRVAGEVMVINTGNNKVINTISLGSSPIGISVTGDGAYVYVANDDTPGTISVISTMSNSVTATVPVGYYPYCIGNFIIGKTGCAPLKYTITVNQAAALPPAISVNTVSGAISACAGTASVFPKVQQFTVSGSSLTDNIKVTAPSNFELSLSPNSGYGSSLTLKQTGGTVNNTIVYVRSAATAATGNISGNVMVASAGASTVNPPVSGTINQLQKINAVTDQAVTNGEATTEVDFSGTATNFKWLNNTPSIGLAANGTGNIASFKAVNYGSAPVTATITVSPVPVNSAYIPTLGSGNVSVVNTATNEITATIPVGSGVTGVSVSPDGGRVYVSNVTNNKVSVINTKTNAVTDIIQAGSAPYALCASPDGSLLYIVNQVSKNVWVVNTTNYDLVAIIPVGSKPYGICISPDGSRVYVVNEVSGSVSVIDAASSTVVATIPVGQSPIGACITPDGGLLYITNSGSSDVSVIDTKANAIKATIPVGAGPLGIAISPDGSKVYTANSASNNVSIINTATNSIISTISTGFPYPVGISLTADGDEVYVANGHSGSVSVINAATGAVSSIAVGDSPFSFGNFVTGTACVGTPITFTITVDATSTAKLTAGTVSGGILACAGTASASPNIQQFTVSGSELTADIVATASAGFEVSLSPGSGYNNSVTLTRPPNGIIIKTPVYVRSSASAAPGNITGTVALTSAEAKPVVVAVTANVNAIPGVDPVSNQSITDGNPTTAVNFTGTATAFDWVNDTPGIGLATGGVGNIPSFIASNPGSTPVTATITVTPVPAGYAYIASIASNSLTVINTATNQTAATIRVGLSPFGVSVSPDGSHVYVTNQGSNNVSVINTATNSVETTIPVGSTPSGVLVSPDGSKVYVANTGSGPVSVIDTKTNSVVANIAAGGTPTAIALSPDGSILYVTNAAGNAVTAVNTATNTVVQQFAVGKSPLGIAITPDGNMVYVANSMSNTVSAINTVTNMVTTIPVGADPTSVSISPDGSQVYVSDSADNDVTVISTLTNKVTTKIPIGSQTFGLSVTPDGNRVFVAAVNSNYISVINTLNNTVIFQIQVGLNPNSLGNFIAEGSSCSGSPITFTITVKPIVRTITATGALSPLATTYGTASATTSFKVSGTVLQAGIVVTPPPGFEVSTDNVTFSPTLVVGGTGNVSATPVYMRLASITPVGNYSGDIMLTSAGAPDVKVPAMISVVSPAALTIRANNITKAFGAVLTGGAGSTAFTAPGLQNGETIGSVTIVYGPGSAAGDAAGTYKGAVVPSSPAGGTFSANNYTTSFVNGDIIVSPEAPGATITATGALPPLSTIYGTPSTAATFTISGTNMAAGILVTPPAGFEVSTDDITFNSTAIVGSSGTIGPTVIYIRLASSTHVGNPSGSIVMTSAGATPRQLAVPPGTVAPAPLTITADNKSKIVGNANPSLTVSYNRFVNNDSPSQLAALPVISTTALTTSPVGQYPITVAGAASPDYTIIYVDGVLTINPAAPMVVIPSAFTPNGDGINDTWSVKSLEFYPNCTVEIYNRYGENVYSSIGYGVQWDGTYKGTALPTGTYYYIINLKNGLKALSGFVAIIR